MKQMNLGNGSDNTQNSITGNQPEQNETLAEQFYTRFVDTFNYMNQGANEEPGAYGHKFNTYWKLKGLTESLLALFREKDDGSLPAVSAMIDMLELHKGSMNMLSAVAAREVGRFGNELPEEAVGALTFSYAKKTLTFISAAASMFKELGIPDCSGLDVESIEPWW